MAMIVLAADFREAAHRRMPRCRSGYAYGTVPLGRTVYDNGAVPANIALWHCVLRSAVSQDLPATLFGGGRHLPIAPGPVGIGRKRERRRAVQAARAAAARGLPFTMSVVAPCRPILVDRADR